MRKAFFLLVIGLISLIVQPVVSYSATVQAFGQSVGTGEAEVNIEGDNWTAVGRSFPVGAEGRYRTGEGRLTFLLKDGTRIELGDNSAMALNCSKGNYTAILEKGKIGVSTNGASSVTVTTPDSLKVVVSEKDSIAGAYFDGKKTQVVSILGDLKIIEGPSVMRLASGNSYIKEIGAEPRIVPVANGDQTAEGEKDDNDDSILELLIPAGIVVGGIALGISSGGDDDGEVASPAEP